MHRHTIRQTVRRSRLVPLAVIATLVAFAVSASAGAVSSYADQSQAPTATTSKATVKSLTKLVKRLTKRVVALEQKKFPDSLPPSGPANGDLSGTYPNPTIKNNVIGPGKIPDETLTGFEIAPDSLYANDLATDSVGATELKGGHLLVSNGVLVQEDAQVQHAVVTCPSGEQATGGGFSWAAAASGSTVIASTPTDNLRGWVVSGRSFDFDNHLYAWVLCLPA